MSSCSIRGAKLPRVRRRSFATTQLFLRLTSERHPRVRPMPEPEPALAIEGLTAGYTDQPVVRDFSTRIERGSITTVIGPNGAGKSTLLKSIYGIGRLFGGRILFDGEPIQHLAPPARLQRGVGFVPQGRCNFPMMSVQENLELGAYTLPRATVTGAIERML